MYSHTAIFFLTLEIFLSNVVQIISQIYHIASILQYHFLGYKIFRKIFSQ